MASKSPARRLGFAAAFLVVAAIPLRPLPGQAPLSDRWYVLTIAGQKVGYVHEEIRTAEAAGTVYTDTLSEMKVTLNRLGNRVETEMRSSSRETAAGVLVSFASETRFSAQVVRTEGVVGPGEIRLSTTTGTTPHARVLNYDGELLGPEGIRALTRTRLVRPGDEIRYQTFSPEFGQVIKGRRILLAVETIASRGASVEALKIEESFEGLGASRQAWLDSEGEELRTSDPSPFGETVSFLADRAEALDGENLGRIPEEQYDRTLIRSNVRLPRAREIDSVTLRLRGRGPGPDWPDFPGPYQKVVRKSGGELVLRIDRPSRSGKGPAQTATPADLEPNAYLDANDPLIRETAARVAGGTDDPYEKAVRLKNWVADNMIFDLGIVSPPATEVIRNRRGTCVGYAMLLATLARAAGLPSRFLMGYVYLNGIWGGHAWSEIFIEDRWLPFDAAVIGPGIADAARVHFSRSTLAAGLGEAVMGGQQLYGALDIEVLEFRLDGKTVRVPKGRALCEIDGDLYINPGLGLKIKKPADFMFADTDKVWPENILLRMAGPDGASLRVLQQARHPGRKESDWAAKLLDDAVAGGRHAETRLGRRPVYLISGAGKAAAAIPNGTDFWVIVADRNDKLAGEAPGRAAEALLAPVLSSLKLAHPARTRDPER